MKIAIASLGNPRSVSTWSGIPSYITLELERIGHQIIPITLDHPKQPWYYDWLRRIYYRLQKKWFLASVEERLLKAIGKQFDEGVNKSKPDVVVVLHGDFLAHATFATPACIIHDTTFATLVNYYADFTNIARRSVRAGNRMYQRALNRTNAAVFSASWASNSAINDYGIDPGKVHTIPFGANLTIVPEGDDVNRWINLRFQQQRIQFLFFGSRLGKKRRP